MSARARRWGNGLAIALGDCVALFFALLAGRALIVAIAGGPLWPRYSLLLLPAWCIGAWITGLLPPWGLDAVEEMRRIQWLLLAVFAGGAIAYFFGRGVFYPSRLAYLGSWVVASGAVPAIRSLVRALLVRTRRWGCPVALYGDRATIEVLIEKLARLPTVGYIPAGIFSDDLAIGSSVAGVPVLGRLHDRDVRFEVAIAPVHLGEQTELAERYDRTLAAYRRLVLLPDMRESVFFWVRPRALGDLLGMEVAANLLNPLARAIKRTFDLAVTLGLMPLWLPLLGLMAAAIRLVDGHRPFFVQTRVGRHGRTFPLVKFRTMYPDAEQRLKALLDQDATLRVLWERDRKLPQDPRVTRWGRFLRRWSLDEIPQFLNVLAGHMSLVGPRPLPPDHHVLLRETARQLRERVRPGMTGLWQVSGRSESGTEGMERWDAVYVRNWSIWLDILILIRTVRAVTSGRGAY